MNFFLLLGLIGEHTMLQALHVEIVRDNYIFASILSITLFIAFAQWSIHSKILEKVAYYGKHYTTGIYIIHPWIISKMSVDFRSIGLGSLFNDVGPIMVFFGSLLVVYIYVFAKRMTIRIFDGRK